MDMVFWSALALVAFTYAGYPLLMALRARMHPRPVRPSAWPATVDVLLVVHDAAHSLLAKVTNLLALDYPVDSLRIHIVCDGCTDDSEAIARRLERLDARIHVHVFAERRGKSACIGHTLPRLDADVVLFTDVRQMLDAQAARRLVDALGDPEVGAAGGRLVLDAEGGYGKGVGAYWQYETRIRALESASGSVVGVSGALYAARRSLLCSVPAGITLDDMWIPLSISHGGRRVVFVADAIAHDRAEPDRRVEEARKRRTLGGNFQLLHRWPGLALPGRHPLVWRLWGHKWLRLLAPWLLLVAASSNLALVLAGQRGYLVPLLAQIVAYTLAVAALCMPRLAAASRPAHLAGAFLSLNLSAACALGRYLRNPRAQWWPVTPFREPSG